MYIHTYILTCVSATAFCLWLRGGRASWRDADGSVGPPRVCIVEGAYMLL
jgi:hypothetical protein